MSVIDIIIIAVFGLAIFRGLHKGIIGQLGSLAAIILAVIACRTLAPVLEPVTAGWVPDSLRPTPLGSYIGQVAAGAVVYIIIYYGVNFATRLLRKVSHTLMLGPVDRVAGAIFAVLKWGLGLSVALNLWLALFPKSEFVKESTIGGGIAVENVMELAPWLWGMATHSDTPDENTADNPDTPATSPQDETL